MKTEERAKVGARASKRDEMAHALERLIELRASVGDGLNDSEFTHLVAPQLELEEEGFSIVGFFDGWVTLRTPRQDPNRWYAKEQWLAEDKEAIASRISKKYNLSVCEPPDRMTYMAPPPGAHHHLEFVNAREAVAGAHPLYLKIRLISTDCSGLIWKRHETLPPVVELFRDLVPLYAN